MEAKAVSITLIPAYRKGLLAIDLPTVEKMRLRMRINHVSPSLLIESKSLCNLLSNPWVSDGRLSISNK